jgi:hypothetical protein
MKKKIFGVRIKKILWELEVLKDKVIYWILNLDFNKDKVKLFYKIWVECKKVKW